MAPNKRHRLGHGGASKDLDVEHGAYGHEHRQFVREIFLDSRQWQNIPERTRPWYEYNSSQECRQEVDAIHRMVIPCIREIIALGLTPRQQEVLRLWFHEKNTQVIVAKKLGISQPTVHQHINGKKRNGKRIGGSVRKIRKLIHRRALQRDCPENTARLFQTLDQLLSESNTRRQGFEILRQILR